MKNKADKCLCLSWVGAGGAGDGSQSGHPLEVLPVRVYCLDTSIFGLLFLEYFGIKSEFVPTSLSPFSELVDIFCFIVFYYFIFFRKRMEREKH